VLFTIYLLYIVLICSYCMREVPVLFLSHPNSLQVVLCFGSQFFRLVSIATLCAGGHRDLAMLFLWSVSSGEVRTGEAVWRVARVTTADSSSLSPCSARAVVRNTAQGSPKAARHEQVT
jgi:hypothetical protein